MCEQQSKLHIKKILTSLQHAKIAFKPEKVSQQLNSTIVDLGEILATSCTRVVDNKIVVG